jgi:fatty acid desaturase
MATRRWRCYLVGEFGIYSVGQTMSERRFRATFLLRLVVLGASLGAFALVWMAATAMPVRVSIVALFLAFWVVGIELDLLPQLIEQAVTTRAARRSDSRPSVWFVDVEAEHRREMERARSATRDNPSLQ